MPDMTGFTVGVFPEFGSIYPVALARERDSAGEDVDGKLEELTCLRPRFRSAWLTPAIPARPQKSAGAFCISADFSDWSGC